MTCCSPVTRRTAIPAAVAALALLASPACSRGGGERGSAGAGPTATVGTEPPRTTTTNPYAVPAVIDVAYVNRVLAGLDSITGDVVRLVVASKTIPREGYDRLRSIYDTDDWLQLHIDIFQADLRKGLAGYQPNPGNAKTTVTQLITVKPACVFARVNRDFSKVGINSTTSDTQWVALRPLKNVRDPQRYNQTSWAFAYDGFTETQKQPPDPCAD